MIFDWQAGLVTFVTLVAVTRIGYWLAFRDPDARRMREWNQREDAERLAKPKYPPIVKQNRLIGAIVYGAFFLAVAPLCVTLAPQPLWKELAMVFAALMIYDFFYYLMHRFLFHGPILLRVHALHHQARDPSHIDSAYVHPVETVMGTALFLGTVVAMVPLFGQYHAITMALLFAFWVQINTVNHAKFDLDRFPYRMLNWLVKKHHVHHINMGMGNYATITMLYDKLFGTLD